MIIFFNTSSDIIFHSLSQFQKLFLFSIVKEGVFSLSNILLIISNSWNFDTIKQIIWPNDFISLIKFDPFGFPIKVRSRSLPFSYVKDDLKISVALCSSVDIYLRFEDSILLWNDRISEGLSAHTTKLEQIFIPKLILLSPHFL